MHHFVNSKSLRLVRVYLTESFTFHGIYIQRVAWRKPRNDGNEAVWFVYRLRFKSVYIEFPPRQKHAVHNLNKARSNNIFKYQLWGDKPDHLFCLKRE